MLMYCFSIVKQGRVCHSIDLLFAWFASQVLSRAESGSDFYGLCPGPPEPVGLGQVRAQNMSGFFGPGFLTPRIGRAWVGRAFFSSGSGFFRAIKKPDSKIFHRNFVPKVRKICWWERIDSACSSFIYILHSTERAFHLSGLFFTQNSVVYCYNFHFYGISGFVGLLRAPFGRSGFWLRCRARAWTGRAFFLSGFLGPGFWLPSRARAWTGRAFKTSGPTHL